MKNHPPVWIVVLTFNRWQDTRACLVSVMAALPFNTRVLIVDNGSTDETLTALPREFPQAYLIRNPQNLGYAEGNNVGLRYALEQGAEFILVLNNDVVVAPDWLEGLLETAQAQPRAALLGPMVYHADDPQVIQSAGGMLSSDWHSYHRGANKTDTGQFHRTENVDWLTGCAVLARSSALRDFGLLDPSFYMYGEDVDWCLRARKANYTVVFVPYARVWHSGVSSAYTPAARVTYYMARNELILIQKHRGGTIAVMRLLVRHFRTVVSWTLRPKWRHQRAHRDALVMALRDFLGGASGPAILV